MSSGLLEETKSVLRSLIISSPHGMTVDRLNRDYRNMEGRAIPYSQLGYNKLDLFLRSLSDTLVVNGAGFNATVTAIASQKTAHIDKMVTKQKSSTRHRAIVKAPEINERNNREIYQPPNSQQSPRHQNNRQQTTYSPSGHKASNSNMLQNRSHLQDTLMYHAQQQQLQVIQQQRIQQAFQQTLLQASYRPSTPASNSYTNLLSHPMYSTPQQKFDNWQQFQYSLQIAQQQQQAYKQQRHVQRQSELLQRLTSGNLNNVCNSISNSYKKSQVESNMQRPENSSKQVDNAEQQKPGIGQNCSTSVATQNTGVTASKNQSTAAPVQNVEEKRLENSTRFDEKHSSNHGSSSVSTLSRGGGSDKNANNEKSPASSATNERCKVDPRHDDDNNDVDAFKDISNEYLMQLEKSFSNLNLEPKANSTRVNRALQNIVQNRKKESENKTPDTKQNRKNEAEAVPELQKNDIVFQLDFPIDTAKYGETIPPSQLPKDLLDASWFGIFVTEIHNPYKFWFHYQNDSHELDKLMQHIENIYTAFGQEELRLKRACFKPGQVCCALFMGMWHRAVILEEPEHSKVKIFFVDYGTVTSVSLDEIKFLLSDFVTLPCQAHRGSLAHIKPVKHRWSRDATYAFLDMVSDLHLYAKATEIDVKEKIVTMILTDTNKKVDFQINEALIRKGHARISSTIESSAPLESAQLNRRKHFQQLYPTFAMLETGEYPSFAEITTLLSKGIDFESLQDENIIPDIDGDIDEIAKKLVDPRNVVYPDEKPDQKTDVTLTNPLTGNEQSELDAITTKGEQNSSNYENESVSTLSENTNPFFMQPSSNSSGHNEATDVANSGYPATSAMPKLDPSNPFLSEYDFKVAAMQPSNIAPADMNGHYYNSPPYQNFMQNMPDIVQHQSHILAQQQTFSGYGTLMSGIPFPTISYANFMPSVNHNMAYSFPMENVQPIPTETRKYVPPPPGYEFVQRKKPFSLI